MAACITNQTTKADCEDASQRDCKWITGVSVLQDSKGSTYVLNSSGDLMPQPSDWTGHSDTQAACVPLYPPGFDVSAQTASNSTTGSTTQTACYQASQNCQVKFVRNNVFSGWTCTQNCQCLDKGPTYLNWEQGRMNLCIALGDCGNKQNLFGVNGQDLSG